MSRELYRMILIFPIRASEERVAVSVSVGADNVEAMAEYEDMERRVPCAWRACRD